MGKETIEGALIAPEILHSISIYKLEAIIIKLDMMKAYDKVSW